METRLLSTALRRHTLYTFSVDSNGDFHQLSLIRLLLVFSILPLLQICGAILDGSLYLPGDGKGLLEHPGQWVMFFTPPTLVLLIALAFRGLISIINSAAIFSTTGEAPTLLRAIIRRHQTVLLWKSRHASLLLLLSLLGMLVAIRNFIQTSDPVRYYGNDIFDSAFHQWGFVFTRINNCFLYIVVFPILLFAVLAVTWTLNRILHAMANDASISVDFFHEDGCGGFSAFGRINLYIMFMWLVLFILIWAVFATHEQTAATLAISVVVSTGIFFLQSILGIYPIYHCLRRKKDQALQVVHEELNKIFREFDGLARVGPLMHFRATILGTSSLPYSRNARIIVNSLRLAPVVLTLVKLAV